MIIYNANLEAAKEMAYEQEKIERDATSVQTTYGVLDNLNNVLRDADAAIRVFYPGADWAQRKGLALLMEEIDKAQESCLVLMRPICNPPTKSILTGDQIAEKQK